MTAADCSTVAQGWYYDDNMDPTQLFVCQQTCDWIQDRAAGFDPDKNTVTTEKGDVVSRNRNALKLGF